MSNLHLDLLHMAQDKNSDANPTPLLNEGANPNIRDPFYHKWTPLHYAVFLNKENFALVLIEHPKCNAQLLDSDGFSPLYWASKKSTARIIKALLKKGCDPNERDMHGMTALFAAVASNKPENVQALLQHESIDVNQPNQFGGSALHHTAYATDNVEIAELLVKAGANLFLYDHENQAPLHVAKRRQRKKLFKFFKRKMENEEPSWECDVSSTWCDSATETSTTSASAQSGIDNDDTKQALSDDDDASITTPRFQSRSTSKNDSNRSSHSLSPPTSTTKTVSMKEMKISPLNNPINIRNAFSANTKDISISLPPSMKANNDSHVSLQSNPSCESNFSQQSSISSNDGYLKDRKSMNGSADENKDYGNKRPGFIDERLLKFNSDPVRINPRNKNKRRLTHREPTKIRLSQSPGPQMYHSVSYPRRREISQPHSFSDTNSNPTNINHSVHQTHPTHPSQQTPQRHSAHTHTQSTTRPHPHLWSSEHQRKLKQVQENKLKIALKMEQSHLNKEARDLLQEQQHHFQFEQEVFYESMKHEYDKLHYQLSHYMQVSKEIIKQNNHLNKQNNQLKMALKYATSGHSGHGMIITTKKSNTTSKSKKAFKKWYKTNIGTDFIEYLELFERAGFDDLRTIRHLNHEQELIDLGIHKTGHRLYILDKIENYKLQSQEVALPAINKSQQNNDNDVLIVNNADCVEGSFKTE